MALKKISILLATYNGEKYISKQLDSILAQTYKNWVVYIHDDGSKDRTNEIIKEYSAKYPDKFVIVDGKSTGGAKNNFFYLMKQVESDIYMCCDQDDYWLPDKISVTLEAFEKIKINKELPCIVHTDLKIADNSLNVISESMNKYQNLNCHNNELNKIVVQNTVTGCTMMFNRILRDMAIKVHKTDSIIMHDWWMALIAAQFGKIYYLDRSTILYRQHDDNSIGAQKFNFRYIISKFRSNKQNIKQSIFKTKLQSMYFVKCYDLSVGSVISVYAKTLNQNKLQRLASYFTNGFRKSGIIRNIGFYIYG